MLQSDMSSVDHGYSLNNEYLRFFAADAPRSRGALIISQSTIDFLTRKPTLESESEHTWRNPWTTKSYLFGGG